MESVTDDMKVFVGLNWTKVGLKGLESDLFQEVWERLNWTKVGLKGRHRLDTARPLPWFELD